MQANITWTPQRHQAAKERLRVIETDTNRYNEWHDLHDALAEIERLQGVIEELNGKAALRRQKQAQQTKPI